MTEEQIELLEEFFADEERPDRPEAFFIGPRTFDAFYAAFLDARESQSERPLVVVSSSQCKSSE